MLGTGSRLTINRLTQIKSNHFKPATKSVFIKRTAYTLRAEVLSECGMTFSVRVACLCRVPATRQTSHTNDFVNAKIQEQLCLDDKFIAKVTPYFLYFQYWNSTVSQHSARDSGKIIRIILVTKTLLQVK